MLVTIIETPMYKMPGSKSQSSNFEVLIIVCIPLLVKLL